MEIFSGLHKEDEQQMELPPGFRFHPTDEELITHYLHKKVLDINFLAKAIGEVDLNKSEPWELPCMQHFRVCMNVRALLKSEISEFAWITGKAKMGEKEWYFFCLRDRKYPTGLRTNRATEAGYWKATGKDKEIYRGNKSLVGMKKTLVFYRGRAPKGQKTNWVMHEYRLDGHFSPLNLPKSAKNEWVICRVFQKSTGGKKIPISGLVRIDLGPSGLPSLTDSSSLCNDKTKPEPSYYVPCFSNSSETQGSLRCFNSHALNSAQPNIIPNIYQSQVVPKPDSRHLQNPKPALMQEPNTEISSDFAFGTKQFDHQEDPSSSIGPSYLESFWNY